MKLSIRQTATLGWTLVLLLAAMLLSTSGAQAASKRGAVLVKDIRPGPASSVTEPEFCCGEISYAGGDLTNVRGTLYFSAEDGAGRHGYELWRSDGTARGTRMVKDINPGAGSSNIEGITAVNGILYFRADDGVHGAELWRSDGTARGTRMVKDINPAGSSYPGGFINVSGTSTSTAHDGTGDGLWRSDGTEAGTGLVKGFGSLGDSSLITDVGGTLYFALSDASAHSEVWRSDGTAAGTGLVKQGFVGEFEVHRLPRHPLLLRRRRHSWARAVAKRRHRAGHDQGQGLHSLPALPLDRPGQELLPRLEELLLLPLVE